MGINGSNKADGRSLHIWFMDGTNFYFLKVYERNRASTQKWTDLYDEQDEQEQVATMNSLKKELKSLI